MSKLPPSLATDPLWQRLAAYPLEADDVRLSFVRRLAAEQAWSLDFATQAIAEYKRFAYLACRAGHSVTPSEEVDAVWHLHLTYTRDYWGEFCPNVLGRELHHQPTVGGASEDRRFYDQYKNTLASYAKFFGEKPPASIWAAPRQRFSCERPGEVDLSQYWLIPKPALPAHAAALGVLAVGGIGGFAAVAHAEVVLETAFGEISLSYAIGILAVVAVIWGLVRPKRRGGGKGGCSTGSCSSSDSSGCSSGCGD